MIFNKQLILQQYRTCHLAGQLARHLQSQLQQEKRIADGIDGKDVLCVDDKDVLCVEIAALCHDLGN